jgi:pimeloyl-ACP methyl ester carboxylesterase
MTAPSQGVEIDHVEFPAGKIRFYRAGTSGPAIVLLHGGGMDNGMLSWRRTIPALAADHTVYVPDLPGQGGSLPWRGRANQRTCEEVLRWLLDSWGVRQATFIGQSMGGSVATGFALRHAQRVSGLVLVDSGGLQARLNQHVLAYLLVRLRFLGKTGAKVLGLHRSLVRRMLKRSVFTGSQPVSDLDEIVEEMLVEIRNRGSVLTDWHHESIGRKAMKVNHLPHLDQIRCPTMVIHGENDRIVPVSSSQEAAGAIAGSALRVLPDAGHWPNREKPTEFNALLREFVNGQR